MRRLLVVNGPNLNLLGTRDPEVYGTATLDDLVTSCKRWGEELGVETRAFQSNHEGAIIDGLHDAIGVFDGIVINPGAFAHTSYAIRDAIEATGIPTVEVHISNILEREPWRRVSVTAPACRTAIYGRGHEGYRWAIRKLWFDDRMPPETLPYGDVADQTGDLRMPEGGAASLVILVHGGFWRHHWKRDLMDGLAVDLTDRGVASWNVEYRRVGTGGGWPETVEDVAAALEVAARRFDRIVVVGHSAGGQLALAAAYRTGIPDLVVSMAGVTDFIAAVDDDLGSGAVDAFLGGATPEPASPRSLLPIGVPQLIVHGTDDETVPVSYGRAYAEAASAAGDPIELLELAGVDHMELIDERSDAWRIVAEHVVGAL